MTATAPESFGTPDATAVDAVFRPAIPQETQAVLFLFAIAARVVVLHPGVMAPVTERLSTVGGTLTPPESLAHAECARLWTLFARVARLPKAGLRAEAGRAFWRDLDALSQRLDLPALSDWQDLPQQLLEAREEELTQADVPPAAAPAHLTLLAVRSEARKTLAETASGLGPADTGALLGRLYAQEREALMHKLVGRGILTRSDVNLLIRYLAKEERKVTVAGVLKEVLVRLGNWLVAEETR